MSKPEEIYLPYDLIERQFWIKVSEFKCLERTPYERALRAMEIKAEEILSELKTSKWKRK